MNTQEYQEHKNGKECNIHEDTKSFVTSMARMLDESFLNPMKIVQCR